MKILLTGGCSFTASDDCWPRHLKDILNVKLLNVGMVSQGNGLISRTVIYNIDKLLNEYKPEEILVGVMWSGIDRYDYYTYSTENTSNWGNFKPENNVQIPTNIIEGNYNWQIINPHWNSNEVKMYYEYFHTSIFATIMTIEHILRVQWYLEKLNIKYFMSTYMDLYDSNLINHPEISYLYKQIDFSKFLPVKGCYEWVEENFGDREFYINHPTQFAHKQFVNKVIVPFIKEKIIRLI